MNRKKWTAWILALMICLPSAARGAGKVRVKTIQPTWLCAGEETPALESPKAGSTTVWTLRTDRFYLTDQHVDQYYLITSDDGETGYADKGYVRICNAAGLTGGTLFKLPHVAKGRTRLPVETVLAYGRVTGGDGTFFEPASGTTVPLAAGERVYVCSMYGSFAGVIRKGQLGYIPRDRVELLRGEALAAERESLPAETGSTAASPLLDAAFSMLEEGNPIAARYEKLTGSETEPLFPAGIPYFWGGQDEKILTERWPLYTVRKEWSGALDFYEKGTAYIYGLDCVGFARTVFSRAGLALRESINELNDRDHCDRGEHLYCSRKNPLPEDWTELARNLKPGDLMGIHHPGRHVMIFIGTLRDYGYTEEQLPAMAEWLDYPLMIHSGENPYAFWRFEALRARAEDSRIAKALGSVGGASICILGVPRERAERVITANERDAYAFDVEGACVTIMSFHNVKDYFVWRSPEEAGQE